MPDKNSKMLVHVCCAACASYLINELEKEDITGTLFFYDPENNEPLHNELFDGLKSLALKKDIPLVSPTHNPEEFSELISPFHDINSIKYINDKERYLRKRREILISLTIRATIKEAKKQKLNNITTSMLCSPYRDHNTIWDTGVRMTEENKLNFYYKDFRKGYWMGRNFARNNKLFVPKYCSDYMTAESHHEA